MEQWTIPQLAEIELDSVSKLRRALFQVSNQESRLDFLTETPTTLLFLIRKSNRRTFLWATGNCRDCTVETRQ